MRRSLVLFSLAGLALALAEGYGAYRNMAREAERIREFAVVEQATDAAANNSASEGEFFRGSAARTGVFRTSGVRALARVRWKTETGGFVYSSPVRSGETVYVGSASGDLLALSAKDGAVRWKFSARSRITSSPAVAGGVVYIGSWDKHLYALDAESGEERWKFRGDGYISSSPVVYGETVYVATWGGYLTASVYALDVKTGEEKWRAGTRGVVESSPAIYGDTLYVGSNDGLLYALALEDGKSRWKFKGDGALFATPALGDDTAYIGSLKGTLYAIDVANGEPRWRFEARGGISSSAIFTEKTVYAGDADGWLYAVNGATGALVWEKRLAGEGGVSSSPALARGVIYVGTGRETLGRSDDAANRNKRAPRARADAPAGESEDAEGFYLYALSAADGSERWKLPFTRSVNSSPLISDRALYVGSDDGKLYAVE